MCELAWAFDSLSDAPAHFQRLRMYTLISLQGDAWSGFLYRCREAPHMTDGFRSVENTKRMHKIDQTAEMCGLFATLFNNSSTD